MTTLGRIVFGFLAVLLLIALWIAAIGIGLHFGPPEWTVR